jgi:uncharacterized protein YjbJ (UPF0337 family)
MRLRRLAVSFRLSASSLAAATPLLQLSRAKYTASHGCHPSLFPFKLVLPHRPKETPMKESTKDQVKGKVHEVKGKVKEKVGRATNNPDLEAEGQDEQVAGIVQKKIGQVEKVFEK